MKSNPSLTDTLCTKCGLCCDGSLFADVELAGRAEGSRLELLGVAIDEDSDAPLLPQPCLALQGTRCGIYSHRPRCCRTFECRLLDDVRRGTVSVEQAGATIADARELEARVQALLTELGDRDRRLPLKERCAETLAEAAGSVPDPRRVRLARSMAALEDALRASFLGPTGSARMAARLRSPRS